MAEMSWPSKFFIDEGKSMNDPKKALEELKERLNRKPINPNEFRYFLPYYEKGVYKGMRRFSDLEFRQYIDTLASERKFEEDNRE